MKIKYLVSLLVLLLSLGAVSGKSDERSIASTGVSSPSVTAEASSPAPASFPDVCIPGVPAETIVVSGRFSEGPTENAKQSSAMFINVIWDRTDEGR